MHKTYQAFSHNLSQLYCLLGPDLMGAQARANGPGPCHSPQVTCSAFALCYAKQKYLSCCKLIWLNFLLS